MPMSDQLVAARSEYSLTNAGSGICTVKSGARTSPAPALVKNEEAIELGGLNGSTEMIISDP